MSTFLPKIVLMAMDDYNKREAQKHLAASGLLDEDMECPNCKAQLDDGIIEEVAENQYEVYHSCIACGAEVYTS